MILTLLLALSLGQTTEARVSLLSGESRTGSLSALDDETVTLSGTPEKLSLPIADVLSIDLTAGAAVPPTDTQLLILTDGSRLSVSTVTRTARQLSAASAWLGALELGNDRVRAVRLQPENTAFTAQWNSFTERESEKDLLIVAKRDGTGLDFLAGVVSSITADQIDFLLDGDTIPVPAARAYGIVFGQQAGRVATVAATRVMSNRGDVVSTTKVTLAAATLSLTTGWNQAVEVPIGSVQRIDLSGSRIAWLSELPALSERFDGVDPDDNVLGGLISREHQQALFGPRRNMTIERQPGLRLRGREFERGLCIHSRTEITWALDGNYSSLECLAGIDDEVAYRGQHTVLLKISGDERVLFEQQLATSDDALPLSIPLAGVSTLSILVDYGDGDSVCDWLDLADAKLIIAKEQ